MCVLYVKSFEISVLHFSSGEFWGEKALKVTKPVFLPSGTPLSGHAIRPGPFIM